MQGHFITTQVRRANRNLLTWNGSVLVLMLVLAWLSRVYWHNFFFGPFHVSDDSERVEASQQNVKKNGVEKLVTIEEKDIFPRT